jgi:holo-[acyl-carrier protein] synthase
MVFGVGIDIIEVERVEHRVASGNGFREMVFSPAEIEYCEKIKNSTRIMRFVSRRKKHF